MVTTTTGICCPASKLSLVWQLDEGVASALPRREAGAGDGRFATEPDPKDDLSALDVARAAADSGSRGNRRELEPSDDIVEPVRRCRRILMPKRRCCILPALWRVRRVTNWIE